MCAVGTDSRPLLINARAKGKSRASERVASRKIRDASNFGVMKSVLRVECRMFSVSYTKDGAEAHSRPVTFAFNGGPGSGTGRCRLDLCQPRTTLAGRDDLYRAAEDGHDGARELVSFPVGQVVGSFREVRRTADVVAEMAADAERRIRDLGAML